MRTDDDEVGFVAAPDEATFAHGKELCRVVAHQFDHAFEREYTLVDQFKHRRQRELKHRHARNGARGSSLLLFH